MACTFEETNSAILFTRRATNSPLLLAWPRRTCTSSTASSALAPDLTYPGRTLSNQTEHHRFAPTITHDINVQPAKWWKSLRQSCYTFELKTIVHTRCSRSSEIWQSHPARHFFHRQVHQVCIPDRSKDCPFQLPTGFNLDDTRGNERGNNRTTHGSRRHHSHDARTRSQLRASGTHGNSSTISRDTGLIHERQKRSRAS